MPANDYEKNVFLNCPFDPKFKTLLEAIVFTIHDCGFIARSALEAEDGSEIRIAKIYRLIECCGFGIHDLSRTELDAVNELPRFKMPLELGLFLGAKRFGSATQQRKNCLILDKSRTAIRGSVRTLRVRTFEHTAMIPTLRSRSFATGFEPDHQVVESECRDRRRFRRGMLHSGLICRSWPTSWTGTRTNSS